MAEILPAVLIGLLLGSLVDRLSRRGLMIGADLLRCAVFCALPFAPGAAAIVALAFVAGIGTGFFRPAVYAGLPNLVSDDDLPGRELAPAGGRQPHVGRRAARRRACSSPPRARTSRTGSTP